MRNKINYIKYYRMEGVYYMMAWCLLRHENKKTGGNVYDCKLLA